MMSNTATPKYYGIFREKVMRGEIVVCEEISMEMNRIDSLIENPGIWYDDSAMDGFIAYCENELCLTDGSPVDEMLFSFKLWGEQIFCWYYYVEVRVPVPIGHKQRWAIKKEKKRLVNKQYLIVGRGNAKSIYDSFIQSYFLNVDTTTTNQVATAPTMRQAEETITPISTSITRSIGPLFKFLTQGSLQNTTGSKADRPKLASTKKGIVNFLTGSILEVRPMSINKLQGLRVKVATVDEWLSGDTREDVIGAIEQGASKIKDYLILASSSEGTVRNGVGDDVKMELMSILRGEYQDIHTSIWYYKLDDIKEINNPDMWIKANPNIGITVSFETIARDVERAENSPANRNDIIAKRFNIPLEGFTYFFTYQETLLHSKKHYYSMPCAMGMDASQGDDFYAFSFYFPLRGRRFGTKHRCYISSYTHMQLSPALKYKYQEFINEGSLIIMDGDILDSMEIYEDIDKFIIENEYDVRAFGYDPYNAKEFVDRWILENGEFGVDKVLQGFKTESVPLGELKLLAEQRTLLFDEEIMKFCMGNAIALVDTNGNKKLYKKRYEKKIDCVSATMDAHIAYKRFSQLFE